jgi:hypothetical protein
VADEDHPGRAEPLPHVAVALGNVGEEPARCSDRHPGHLVQVLECKGYPEQRRQIGGIGRGSDPAVGVGSAASACSAYTRTNALIECSSPSWLCVPSTAVIRSRQAVTSSVAVMPPVLIAVDASTTPSSQRSSIAGV